ncbi:MAG: fructosidase [Verrucomicrobiia bacterium Tous-C3TDCM]|nr:MAG: fructosidase [Verrucomicrobiae bacterium Tous-C3TDCM]PAZ05811.1 MAG: fructosidase [Verrucomicrobiae bacterium AMD-G2]
MYNHLKTTLYSFLLWTSLFSVGWGDSDPELKGSPPFNRHYRPTDYQEPYRPQFHFSPQNGWMNDINALWYLDGKYHMLYQWGVKNRDGAYASSADLLHWTDYGLALIGKSSHTLAAGAKQNVSGEQIYSGSGIVVSGSVAEKITGSPKSALITLYTGTEVGTCIAWSNDKGQTWNNYDKNPVANPTSGADPRDPRVIWHEPTKKWVMAIYEEGTTFYGSKDLINWEKLSNIKFGFECPDLVELPLDGDPNNMKWVIYDAAGKYLVGHFDGTSFSDENHSKEYLYMDVGPDFYAGQTFFPFTLPQKKYIQLAWMDEWNGGIGEKPWERNATFPVELGLVTRDGKMRVTRTPIAAIKDLYVDPAVQLGKMEVGTDNILKDVRSKTFDITLTIDLKGATAQKIVFQIANVSYQYDITEQKIIYQGAEKNKFGDTQPPVLRPDSNQILRIRMLVDWSSIEIFSDGGVFSLSQQVAFDPEDDSLTLTAIGGNVKLVNLELHKIKSIWR